MRVDDGDARAADSLNYLQREGETPQARRGGLFANHPIRANAPNLSAPSDFCMWDAPTDCGTPRHIGLWMSLTGPKRISLSRGNSVAFGLMRTLDWIL
ncbi:MAG: hypothetical protein WA858_07035 [Xanthobacteraceae bacterium]